MLLAFVAGLIVSPASALTLWIGKHVIDNVLVKQDVSMLKLCVLGVVVLYSVEGVFRFLQTYVMNTTSLLVLNDLRLDMYEKIVRLPSRYFEKSQVGMLMSRVLNDVSMLRMSAPSVIMLVRETLQTFFLIGYAVYTDPVLAGWSVIILPVTIWPVVYFGRRMRKLGRRGQSQIADVNVQLQESFNGVRVIKAFANECKEQGRFRKNIWTLTRTLVKQVLASELSSRIMEFITAVGGAAVLYAGGMYVINGNMTPGELVTFIGSLALIYQPIKKISSYNITLQQALAGAERVFDIFDNPDIREEDQGDVVLEPEFHELAVKNVSFTYQSADRPALDGIDLTIRAGERVAVVGPSGSGKTTLVNLVPRFYDPDKGGIFLNGRDVREYTLDSLRLNMGIVSQESFLFNDTIRNNLAYAPGEFSQEQIENAARAAFAHDFIMEQPHGYDTVIGERGAMLSGGQKQRLTIARALLKNPPLLILDEATSALDTESERIVQKALDNLMQDRTSIVIAHRLSTILNADSIVVMQHGRIVDQGRHEELLERCDLYAKLYRMQFGEE